MLPPSEELLNEKKKNPLNLMGKIVMLLSETKSQDTQTIFLEKYIN